MKCFKGKCQWIDSLPKALNAAKSNFKPHLLKISFFGLTFLWFYAPHLVFTIYTYTNIEMLPLIISYDH